MRLLLFGLMLMAASLPTRVSGEGTLQQPKYPPGFDCSAVAAGSQRQACNSSHLDPPMGAIPETKRSKPSSIIPPPKRASPAPIKPSTIPRLPGTIE